MPDLRPGPLALSKRLITRVRARGPREVWGLGAARIREFVGSNEQLTFYVRPAEGGPEERPQKWEGLELETAGPEHGRVYAERIGTDSPTTFRGRLAEHTRCYLVVHEATIVHASWVTTAGAWVREVRRFFRPPPGDAYVYESFTRAEARGKGVYPFALVYICERLATEGSRRVWVGVEESNEASKRSVSKAGFEPGFRVSYGRRMGILKFDPPVVLGDEKCPDCLVRTIRI
ncbi:MAG: GNAT family N-acetyltransferase [Actinomycetota bacterium]|nr:GNAT family N-acetyltransferase [Actinomycetota bacterium]